MIEIVLAVSTLLGGLAALWYFWDRLFSTNDRASRSEKIFAYRVSNAGDPLFHDALALYAREPRIPNDEKYCDDEMVRWVNEAKTNPLWTRCRFIDDMIVAVENGQARGLAHITHYRFQRKSFVSYMVAGSCRGPNATTNAIVTELYRLVRRRIPWSRYLIAELDDPRLTDSPPQQNLRLARIRLFGRLAKRFGRPLRILDVPYLQPCLDPTAHEREKPLLLVFVPLGPKIPSTVSRAEAVSLVRFVLESVYGDSFITSPDQHTKYRDYVRRLGQQITADLPESIRLLTLDSLRQEVRDRRLARGPSACTSSCLPAVPIVSGS